MKNYKWITFSVLLTFSVFSGAYWVKNKMSINIFDGFHLSSYFPFNYLLPEAEIDEVAPGYSRMERFDDVDPFGGWRSIWSEDEGAAERYQDADGYNYSKCLLVTSKKETFWTLNSGYYIKVRQGDVFRYEAKVRLGNPVKKVYIAANGYNRDRSDVIYDFVEQKVDASTGEWQSVGLDFTVPSGVDYIMLRAGGVSAGTVRFDDIHIRYLGRKPE